MEPDGKDPPSIDPVVLFTMRVADMTVHLKGQLQRPCANCGEIVTISQSGQRMLRDMGEANVIIRCTHCFDPADCSETRLAPGAIEEALAWRLETELKKTRN